MGTKDNGQSAENTSPRKGGMLVQTGLFIRNFIKYPAMVGWLMPSSRFLVNGVLRQIDWSQAKVIVEYGAGTGTFTKSILERMRPDAKLVALEINPEFYRFLQSSMTDPRLHVIKESAEDVDEILERLGCPVADCVISGIPFSSLPHAVRDTIVRKTHSVLRPRGKFLVYQVSTVILPYLESVFGEVSRDFELLNLIPARLFYCART